jgi:hypothetical protein
VDTLSKGIHVQETSVRAAGLTARIVTTLAGAALVGWSAVADAHWAERHVLPSYCATGPVPWGLARALPFLAAGLGVLAIWKLAPAAAKLAVRVRARRPAGGRAWPGIALAVAASLAAGEGVARWLHDRVMLGGRAAAAGGDASMTRVDSRLGWSYVPGRTTWIRQGDRAVAYAIDADGDRAASSGDRPDPARPTLLFAGESIAFGYGLSHEETIPAVVGRDLGVQAVNLAVVGYGNDQAHLRVVDALPRFARPLAVVSVFLPDQLRRNVEPWRPRLALGPDGALAPVPASNGPRLLRLLEEVPFHGDGAVALTAAILRATADAARARGAVPLFVVTNYGSPCVRDQGEAWLVDELFTRQGLPFVRVDLDRGDRLPGLGERHPSGSGALKIARAVELALSDLLDARSGGRRAAAQPTGAVAP